MYRNVKGIKNDGRDVIATVLKEISHFIWKSFRKQLNAIVGKMIDNNLKRP